MKGTQRSTTVGQRADLGARAVDAEVGARHVGAVRHVTLGGVDLVGDRPIGRADRYHVGRLGERLELIDRHTGTDRLEPGLMVHDPAAERLDPVQQGIAHLGLHVDQGGAVARDLDRGTQGRHGAHGGIAAPALHLVE